MFYLAKLVQAFGLADVGYALVVGMTEANSMGRELKLMLIGLAVFGLGYLMEQKAAVRG